MDHRSRPRYSHTGLIVLSSRLVRKGLVLLSLRTPSLLFSATALAPSSHGRSHRGSRPVRRACLLQCHQSGLKQITHHLRLLTLLLLLPTVALTQAAPARPHVLALYSTNVEGDHVDFARQALVFLNTFAKANNLVLIPSTNWSDLNPTTLASYQLVLWLDDFPHSAAQRAAFETYMEHGGAWLGFHIAAYNDSSTNWPWFLRFLGGGVFETNSWPPLPAVLLVDAPTHPVTRGLPHQFTAPANEWYLWQPSPRSNPDVDVLLTLSPANYPLGFKDVLTAGDLPVVWTNKRYKMLYLNMGHGDKIFTSPAQNQLIQNSLTWLLSRASAK